MTFSICYYLTSFILTFNLVFRLSVCCFISSYIQKFKESFVTQYQGKWNFKSTSIVDFQSTILRLIGLLVNCICHLRFFQKLNKLICRIKIARKRALRRKILLDHQSCCFKINVFAETVSGSIKLLMTLIKFNFPRQERIFSMNSHFDISFEMND